MSLLTNKKFIFSIFIIVVLLVLRDILDINISQYIIFGAMLVTVTLLPYYDALYYTSFACGIISGVNAYFLLFAYIILILKDKKPPTTIQILPLLFFLLLEFINNVFWTSDISFAQYLLYASYLAVFFYFSFLKDSHVVYQRIITSFIIGLAVTLIFVSFGILENPQLLMMDESMSRGKMGFSQDLSSTHFVLNANTIGYFSCTLLSFLFLGYKSLGCTKLAYYILLSVALISGLLSQSRTWIFIVIIGGFFMLLSSDFKQKVRLIIGILVMLTMIAISASELMDYILTGVMNRFESEDIHTAGGRTEIFTKYNEFMFSNPRYFFGGTGILKYREIAHIMNSCHNGTQQIFVSYGLIGLLFLFLFIVKSFKLRCDRCTIVNYISAIIPFLFIQSIQFINPHYLMFPIAMSAIILRIPQKSTYRIA